MKKLQWPWAKRKHSHPAPLCECSVCSGCGHLILIGHVRNKQVKVIDRSQYGGLTVTHIETFAHSCAPAYDVKEIGLDGKERFYVKNPETGEVKETLG